jgi:hypothetical protein
LCVDISSAGHDQHHLCLSSVIVAAKVHLPPPLAAPLNAAKTRSIAQVGPSIVIGILASVCTFDTAWVGGEPTIFFLRRQHRSILFGLAALLLPFVFPMDVS